ncbi:MAG: hypothetical protein ABIH39_04890, partial [Candidatus Margulisiibacteriota bacterium]
KKVLRFVVVLGAVILVMFSVACVGCGENPVGPTPNPTPTPTPVEPTPVDPPDVFHRLLDANGNPTPVTVRIDWVKPPPGSRVTPGPLQFGYMVDPCANNACFEIQAQFCMDTLPSGRVDTERSVVSWWSEDGIRPYSGGGYQRWGAGAGGIVTAGSCFSKTRTIDNDGLVGFAPGGSQYLLVSTTDTTWDGHLEQEAWADSVGRYAYHTDYHQ